MRRDGGRRHARYPRQRGRRTRTAGAAAPLSMGTRGPGAPRSDAAARRRRRTRLHLGPGHERGPPHGGAPAIARHAAGQPRRPAFEELRPLADRRLRDLDGRTRFGAALSDARRGDDPADPRALRIDAAVRRQARWLGRDARRHPCVAAVHRHAAGAAERLPAVGRHRRLDRAARGPAGAGRRRAFDHHLHVGNDGHAEGRDAQLRDLRLVALDRPAPRAARRRCAIAQLSAARPRRRACAGRARAARERAARLLRRKPRHLHGRSAAGAADRLLLGAAPVGEISAGRRSEDAAGQAAAPAAHPGRRLARAPQDPEGARSRCLSPRDRRRRADAA